MKKSLQSVFSGVTRGAFVFGNYLYALKEKETKLKPIFGDDIEHFE